MENKIQKNSSDFLKKLQKYLKHPSIALDVTLENNTIISLSRFHYLDGSDIVEYHNQKETQRVPLDEVKKVEVYVVN